LLRLNDLFKEAYTPYANIVHENDEFIERFFNDRRYSVFHKSDTRRELGLDDG
jgi:hypothetical protein